jgi:hypothetical protein
VSLVSTIRGLLHIDMWTLLRNHGHGGAAYLAGTDTCNFHHLCWLEGKGVLVVSSQSGAEESFPMMAVCGSTSADLVTSTCTMSCNAMLHGNNRHTPKLHDWEGRADKSSGGSIRFAEAVRYPFEADWCGNVDKEVRLFLSGREFRCRLSRMEFSLGKKLHIADEGGFGGICNFRLIRRCCYH